MERYCLIDSGKTQLWDFPPQMFPILTIKSPFYAIGEHMSNLVIKGGVCLSDSCSSFFFCAFVITALSKEAFWKRVNFPNPRFLYLVCQKCPPRAFITLTGIFALEFKLLKSKLKKLSNGQQLV